MAEGQRPRSHAWRARRSSMTLAGHDLGGADEQLRADGVEHEAAWVVLPPLNS